MSDRSSCSSSLLTSAALSGDAQSGGKLGQSGLTPASQTDRRASSDMAFHRAPSLTSNTHMGTASVGYNTFHARMFHREQQCADTAGTVPVHCNAKTLIYFSNKIHRSNLSNITRKMLWFEPTKVLIAV